MEEENVSIKLWIKIKINKNIPDEYNVLHVMAWVSNNARIDICIMVLDNI
jgi:hypothetical protein